MKINNQKGFIGAIVLIVVALVLLQYIFHIDIIAYLQSPKIVEIVNYIKSLLQKV